MKLFISLDMEGIAGIANSRQQIEDKILFRDALHAQLEWLILGIRASELNAEVSEITVADSHASGTNLVYERVCAMDERIALVSGSPRCQFMIGALDESYDMVFLTGYHAGIGHFGCMDHCYAGKTVSKITINGKEFCEATANAACAGDFGVPVALVTGDSGLYQQLVAEAEMPWVEFVVAKETLSGASAKFLPQKTVKENTIRGVGTALRKGKSAYPLYTVKHPCNLAVSFHRSVMADMVAQIPGAVRVDARTISVVCKDMPETLRAISAITALAGTVA